MSLKSWRRPLVTLVALASALVAAACSDALTRQGDAVGSTGTTPAAIGIQPASSFVTIENRAGLPLADVTVTVKATNGISFSKSISRLEASAKRDLSLSELRGNDGTTFSPMFHKPKEVVVTATDVVGKKYDVTAAWK